MAQVSNLRVGESASWETCTTMNPERAIIHLDMDCFYAAIEVRDRPELKGKPVGVGGARDRRGVLTTCNYEARKFGVHSAMPTFMALQRCPRLIMVPTRFDVYRRESATFAPSCIGSPRWWNRSRSMKPIST